METLVCDLDFHGVYKHAYILSFDIAAWLVLSTNRAFANEFQI